MAATQQSLIALLDTVQPRVIDPLDRMQIEAHSSRLEHRPSPPLFDGKTYEPAQDEFRLAGLWARVYNLMSDQRWRTLQEIKTICGGSEAGVSARLRDFRKMKFGSHTVNRRRRNDGGLFEYQVLVNR